MIASTAARVLFHPSNHIWLRAKPFTKNISSQLAQHRFLEIGITDRGLDDIGDIRNITSIHRSMKKSNNSQQLIQRGDELLQIHFDGHTRTSADELYHAIWETYSDNVSIQSPISGRIEIVVGDDTDTDTDNDTNNNNNNNIDTIFKSIVQNGIDEETVLIEIMTTEEEWKHACQQNSDFVNETEYLKIIQNIPRGSFYDGE
jgi:hypothetical protein